MYTSDFINFNNWCNLITIEKSTIFTSQSNSLALITTRTFPTALPPQESRHAARKK